MCAAAALVAVAGCGGGKKAPRIDGVREFPGLSNRHVPHDVTYAQTPPAGGDHSPAWLRCGVYAEPLPDVNAVHSLEHGAVWITHRPDLPQADRDTLQKLQAIKATHVLISPYEGLPSPVVASAWGLQLQVERAADPRLAEFTRTYAGGKQGGEQAGCLNGLTPEQARRFNVQAAASASP